MTLEEQLLLAARLGPSVIQSLQNQIEHLLAHGADINTTDLNGFTPLIWASALGHTKTVIALAKQGADVNYKTHCNLYTTALIEAVKKGHIDCIKALMEYHIDVNATDIDHRTALFIACSSRKPQPNLIKCLIEYGADINAQDIYSNTPLIKAAHHPVISEMLLGFGAKISIKNDNGWTALDVAKQRNCHRTIEMMRDYKNTKLFNDFYSAKLNYESS